MRRFINLKLFKKAYDAIHDEIFASLSLLGVATVVFTAIMWIAERSANAADNYGECVAFERNTEKLQSMLEQSRKETLRKSWM